VNEHRYIIGAGYHEREGRGDREFFRTWLDNTYDHANPVNVIVLADSGLHPRRSGDAVTVLQVSGNLGYHLDLIEGRKKHHFAGGPAMVMALAMIAYCDESDFIYKEQDCLWFGDCVGRMYAEIGDAGLICGRCEQFPVTNSLFLVKHAYIPEFVRLYLGTAPEHDEDQLCERKFERFVKELPTQWKTFSFGYDRDRPFNVKDPEFYIQQVTPGEMEVLKAAGLI